MSVYSMPYTAVGFSGKSLLRRRRPTGGAVNQDVPAAAAAAAGAGGGPSAPGGTAPVGAAAMSAGDTGCAPAATQSPVTAAWTPPSWEEVVQEHSARVYRLAYRLTGNRHDAEDLTQEVFVRVFRSLSSYTPGTFEGWLHRITTNLFLDQVRRKQRIRFDALPEDASDRLPGQTELGPERAWEQNNLDHDVQAALDTLPPDFRAAVVLCDIEGLSYEEIAATLDVKLGTVRSRIHRGRAQLRQALAHRRPAQAPAAPAGSALGPEA
ncbi:MAG TPA: RNA polymerase sigma factor SigE [Kineosporiaceae bacterium]|nr:RNA polymerase sigma factor SigE [Kineosporiaceae bacterium]